MTTTVNNKSEVVQSSTTISIDAMGGDLGPAAIVAGVVRVARRKQEHTFPSTWAGRTAAKISC